ncbi:sulfotransferase [Phyllobacterium sp. 21LDTY02-6]|uniref:sulfotransferase family protein n=1 Tax=Phyllobacterium sp. 21LDTY02-6 TaxID=2944903 RepID=UPI002021D064|nr:sulfotransferase [Phyllobacterium sp. 21LDTY02-6]MCO4317790.1 sulfotransferase [Phyllobacterium sp. 21LDTY02-6]
MSETNSGESAPIIICGCKRSGTTALVRIMNDNGIMISNEWALFAWPSWQHKLSLRQWLENKRAAVDQDPWLQHWHLKIVLAGDEADKGFAPALHSVYGNRPRWTWGDKWSDYVFHVRDIKAHFPDAKILYIYRDGRDVAASMLRKGMAGSVAEAFRLWVDTIEAWRGWEKEFDHLAIRQEDLLGQPERVAVDIARYCSFPLRSADHAGYVVLGADAESPADYVSKNPFKHKGAYHDQFSDADIPAGAMRHLRALGYMEANALTEPAG